MDTRTAPVVHSDKAGNLQSQHSRGAPLVKVRFTWQAPALENGVWTLDGLRETWAIIDTGADVSMISARLMQGAGPVVETLTSTGATGHQEVVTTHQISLIFPPSTHAVNTVVCSSSGFAADCAYQMILGRNVLMSTRFTYDGPRGISSIYILNEEELGGRTS